MMFSEARQMSSSPSKRGRDPLQSFPGCVARMINILNLSSNMARTKLLTERPHRDVNGDCSNVTMKPYPSPEEVDGKQIIEQRSSSLNKISGGTPIKMLISQEMCGDIESRQKAPSVVARLMGLESLPTQQSVKNNEKNCGNGYLSHGSVGEFQQCRQQESDYVDRSMAFKIKSFAYEKKEYRDVYEVQQQPSKNIWIEKEQSPEKLRYDEDSYSRRMALVRQKFIEAKQLATDGKLLESKEFQDAVDVLNSNRDLFLKFLEEPSSMLPKHLFEQQSYPLPPQTTRITVLKPSTIIDSKCEKYIAVADEGKLNKHKLSSSFSEPKGKDFSQPTRIVVLKPSPGKPYNIKTTHRNISPTSLDVHSSSGTLTIDELVSSRETTDDTTGQRRETLGSNRKDETVVSSVLSNGYIGDESSFNRSGSEFMEDEVGSISDSEIATSATECSWEYLNKVGSPFSSSSFNQTSHSPESSVIREAKKRLSERLAMVASNLSSLEQIQLRRSSSTLGEMLSIPELKKERLKEEFHSSKSFDVEDESKVPSVAFCTFGTKDESTSEDSRWNLSRSRSLPVSSACQDEKSNVGESSTLIGKPIVQTSILKSNSSKLSFKDKVSSLFFSRNKKTSGQKPYRSPSIADVSASHVDDTSLLQTNLSDESPEKSFAKGVTPNEELCTSGSCVQNPCKSGQIPPSGATLADGIDDGMSQSARGTIAGRPQAVSRSPPIESVARSLSWNSAYLDIASAKSLNPFIVFSKADEEHDQFLFLQKLISSSGMEKKSMIYGTWHSLDSPLNPSLLYDFLHVEHEEEKCEVRKASRKLLFDSANAALLEISHSALFSAYPWSGPFLGASQDETSGSTVVDEIWAIIRKGLAGDKWVPKEPSYSSIMVDCLVKEEITGGQWDDPRWLEVCEFSKEVSENVVEELVEELLSENLSLIY